MKLSHTANENKSETNEGYFIVEITDINGLKAIEEKWKRFQNHCEINIPFNTYDWYYAWWENFRPSNSFTIYVVYIDETRGRICAILPIYKQGKARNNKNILATWSNTHSFRTGILCDKEHFKALDAIFTRIGNDLSWDYIHIPYLVADNATENALKNILSKLRIYYLSTPGMISPVLELDGNWDEYFDKLGRKTRESLRRKSRKVLEKSNGNVEIFHGTTNELNTKLEDCWKISKNTWKHKIGSSIASDNDRIKFYEKIAINENGWIVLALLYIDNTPTAFEYNIIYNKTLYNLKLGYDQNYKKYSPGIVLRLKMLEWAFSNKDVNRFDYMGNAAEYKMMFSTGQVKHINLTLYSRSLRHAILVLYRRKLRPVLSKMIRPLKKFVINVTKSKFT